MHRSSRCLRRPCASQLTKTSLVTVLIEEVAIRVLPSPEIQDECVVHVGLTSQVTKCDVSYQSFYQSYMMWLCLDKWLKSGVTAIFV